MPTLTTINFAVLSYEVPTRTGLCKKPNTVEDFKIQSKSP